MRAILLARATRTSIGGLRATMRAIHDPAGAPWRATWSKTLFAPMMGRPPSSGGLNPDTHGRSLDNPQATCRLSQSQSVGPRSARTRSSRAHAVHDRVVFGPCSAEALSGWLEQGR